MAIRVQEAPFDFPFETTIFQKKLISAGAVVTFSGIVRNDSGSLDHMFIEHYPDMTEAVLQKIEIQTIAKFGLEDTLIIHRYGILMPGETIMMVATAARHRKDAIAGADYIMDYLKSRAPFWKKEISNDQVKWVKSKAIDEAALASWSQEPKL